MKRISAVKRSVVRAALTVLTAAAVFAALPASAERDVLSGDEVLLEEGFVPYDGEPVRSVEPEALAVFSEAAGAYVPEQGEKLPEPIVLLGTQAVAGINYKFLCVDENGGWSTVTVYAGFGGSAEVQAVVPFDFAALDEAGAEADVPEEPVGGGWKTVPVHPENVLSAEQEEVFREAVSERKDIVFTPLAVLGVRIGAGLDTAVLCLGEGETCALYAVTVNEAPDGTARLVRAAAVDIAAV